MRFSYAMMVLSIAMMALSYVAARRNGGGRVLRWVVAVAVMLVLLLAVFFLAADYFTGKGIDESVLYHMGYGLSGAGFGEYKALIAASATCVLLSFGVAAYVFKRLSPRPGRNSTHWVWASIASLLAAVSVSPAATELAGLQLQRWKGAEAGTGFHYLRPDVKAAKTPMNLVVVYLESLERTYLDDRLFPGLAPGLKRLEKEGTTYTDVKQVYGTGWTVAGITASMCGVPLVTASAGDEALGNSMSGLTEFLPGALCLGDILASHGYRLDYLGGASLEFAGKGNFFRTHGFQTVQGYGELAGKVGNRAYRSAWGLHDDTIFDLAVDRFSQMVVAKRPFGLFLLTLGTHHPRGHMSARCEGVSYGSGDNPMLNAVQCTDALVTDYVERIRKADRAGNTLIVIASDHLAMANAASGQLRNGDRKNLLLILPPGERRHEVVGRAASTLDIAPTVLSRMGFDANGLGLGRDLARRAPTIMESIPEVNGFLASQSSYLSGLWQFPQLKHGLVVEPGRRTAKLGESSIKLPAMLVVGPKTEVDEIRFEFHTPSKNLVDHLAEMSPSQALVWLDACSRVSIVDTINRLPPGRTGLCAAVGRMDAQVFHVSPLQGQVNYDLATIKAWLSGPADSRALAMRRERLENYRRIGSPQWTPLEVFPGHGFGGDVVVLVSGGPGPSFVGQPRQTPAQGAKASRGLTLFGVRENVPVKLAHFDSCDPRRPVPDDARSSEPFARHIAQTDKDGYAAYLILGHDSVRCRAQVDLERMFEGLPLKEWKRIGYRQTYLGVIARDGKTWERIGAASAPMGLRLTQFAAGGSGVGMQGRL